jgi:hypothetical protein
MGVARPAQKSYGSNELPIGIDTRLRTRRCLTEATLCGQPNGRWDRQVAHPSSSNGYIAEVLMSAGPVGGPQEDHAQNVGAHLCFRRIGDRESGSRNQTPRDSDSDSEH